MYSPPLKGQRDIPEGLGLGDEENLGWGSDTALLPLTIGTYDCGDSTMGVSGTTEGVSGATDGVSGTTEGVEAAEGLGDGLRGVGSSSIMKTVVAFESKLILCFLDLN